MRAWPFDPERDTRRLGNWKPEPMARTKAREDRQEAAVIQRVRAAVLEREGHACRLARTPVHGVCFGELELAHLPKWRRSATRGKPAEERHCTQGCVMLCTHAHNLLDGRNYPRLIVEHGELGADGPMTWICGGEVYRERERRTA